MENMPKITSRQEEYIKKEFKRVALKLEKVILETGKIDMLEHVSVEALEILRDNCNKYLNKKVKK